MKKAFIYTPIVLSFIVLGAHFLRYGNVAGVIGSLLLLALLIVRRPWVARLAQAALVLGGLEWVRTLYGLVQLRVALGEPVARMSVILGAVAAVTFCSALLFQLPLMKKIYGLERRE